MTKNYYEILEIGQSASVEVINAAYRALSKKYHPDVCKMPNAAQMMQEINNARDVLTDALKRADYDRKIAIVDRQTAYQSYASKPTPKRDVTVNEDDIESQWIEFKRAKVRVSYFEAFGKLHINFYTKDDNAFHEIKDMIKYDFNFKWEADIKYWRGSIATGLRFLAKLGIV